MFKSRYACGASLTYAAFVAVRACRLASRLRNDGEGRIWEPSSAAPFLASSSAISFPAIPEWPGTHRTSTDVRGVLRMQGEESHWVVSCWNKSVSSRLCGTGLLSATRLAAAKVRRGVLSQASARCWSRVSPDLGVLILGTQGKNFSSSSFLYTVSGLVRLNLSLTSALHTLIHH